MIGSIKISVTNKTVALHFPNISDVQDPKY